MGACCSRASDDVDGDDDHVVARDVSDAFHEATCDAFVIDWDEGATEDARVRFRDVWRATASCGVIEREACEDDADRLAALGELEAALWVRERRWGMDAPAEECAERWRDIYEQAIALNDIELEEHHDGWKAVDKAAKKAVKKRRQSSAEIDADIVIGANHSRRASSVDTGSRRTSSVDFGSRRTSSVDFGNRRTSDTSVHERPSRPRRNSDTMEWTATKSSQFPEAVNRGAVKLGRTTSKLNVLDFGRVGPSPRTSEEKTEGQRTPPADPLAPAYRSKQDVENEKMERELARRLASQQPEVGTSEQVIEMRETFEDDPDLDERLVIYYGRFKGGTVHSIKLSATFDAPPHRLVAVAREWDLMTKWNVYAIETCILLVRGLMHIVVYSAVWLPWPLSARDKIIVIDACFVGQPPKSAYKHLDIENIEEFDSEVPQSCAILLTRTSKPGDDVGSGAPPSSSKRKRIDFVGNCGMRMRALPPLPGSKTVRTRGDIVVHADVKLRFIPAPVVRFVLRTMAPWVHRMIDKMLKSNKYFVAEDSLFQPRIDGNPELYDMIRRRLGETEHGTTTE